MVNDDIKNLRNLSSEYHTGEAEHEMSCEIDGKEVHFLFTTYREDDGYSYHIYSEDANIWDEMSVPELDKLEYRIQAAIVYGRFARMIDHVETLEDVSDAEFRLMEDDDYNILDDEQRSEVWKLLNKKECSLKKKAIGKQVQTRRGLVYVETAYPSEKCAESDGFSYAWDDPTYGPLFSKCLDERGLRHVFAVILKP